MGTFRRYVFGMLLGMSVTSPAQAQAPTARAWADSTHFIVGDPVHVHVEIANAGNLSFTSLVGDTAGTFHILDRKPLKSSGTTLTTSYVVSAYDSGTAILPPFQFAYKAAADSALHTVATNPLVFTVGLMQVDTAKGFKDIKPPLTIPVTLAEISLIIGTLTGIWILAYSLYRYRKRKKASTTEEEYAPPPKLAHIQALEELAILKEKRLWQQGLIKPYYSDVTEILRRYFENRFGFMALEKTTDETMDDLRRFTAAHKYLEPTDRLLRRADLVKFAKYQPTIPEHEEMLTTAFDIVNGTKVIEVTPVEDNSGNRPASGKPAYAGAVHGGQNGEGEMKNV